MRQQFCVGCECFIVAVFHWHGCFVAVSSWCNLSAGLFEELDPLEQRVSAGRV